MDADGKRRMQTFRTEAAAGVFRRALMEALLADALGIKDAQPPPPKAETKPPRPAGKRETGLSIIWGVPAIAKAICRTDRATYHMLEGGHLPGARKVGGRWCIPESRLRAIFLDEE